MIVIDELKHNKLVQVHLPNNSDFFARFGYSSPSEKLYSGDEDLPDYSSKVDTLQALHNQYKDFIPPSE